MSAVIAIAEYCQPWHLLKSWIAIDILDWVLRAPTRSRLKLIPRVANVEQWARDGPLSTPEYKLLVNYNDKPVLTRPQHRFYFGPGYVEVVLDIHAWAYLARKAFSSYIPRLGTVVFENAFVIQASSSLTEEWVQM